MSSGAVFKLIANDGKADRLILATDLLNKRIKDITCMRQKQGESNTSPTLVDIERTHILFVNAHFKPFAALGFEYNKVSTNTGVSSFGGSIQFNIPQFGDFFCDMVVSLTLAQTAATVGSVPAFPDYIGADDQSTSSTAKVSAKKDTANGIYTKYTHEYVDAAGNVLAVGSAASNYVRYAEFPGQRIFKTVKFDVNNNPLDMYTAEAVMFYQKFKVAPNKMIGWKRLVGQEVPVDAYSDLLSIHGASNYSSAIADLVDVNGKPAKAAPISASVSARKQFQVVSGPQTPKAVQPALDLWVPLIFWFRDPRLSIASVAIPYGARFITIDLEHQANLLFVAPGNLFLRLTVERTVSADTGRGTNAAIGVSDVKREVYLTPALATGSTIDTTQAISNVALYINNIFMNPEIHDIYIRRIGFSLIRVHRLQTQPCSASASEFQLSNLKWPIESMFVGLRPDANVAASNLNQYRDWHNLTAIADQKIDVVARSSADVMTDDNVAWNADSEKHKVSSSQTLVETTYFPESTETIDTLEIVAHGITLFSSYKAAFYRDYMPWTYGGANLNTPEDKGALLVNFCLYPGTYQPSGHINTSRAREFFFKYTSNYCSSSNTCTFLVDATALNFLLISDGSAVLRYST